jgi:8-oxo-dGTP pyrophosphatase MutT (NUDIX family)
VSGRPVLEVREGQRVQVRRQASAGGVIVRTGAAGEVELCVINPVGRSVWALPKGGIEPGETDEAAALREVREETGIEGVILDDLGIIDYWFYSRSDDTRVHKTVHFFLMRATGGDTSRHDHEVSDARWLTVDGALDRMTYPNERQMVRLAVEKVAAQSETAAG